MRSARLAFSFLVLAAGMLVACAPVPVRDFSVTDAKGKAVQVLQRTRRPVGAEGRLEPSAERLGFSCAIPVPGGDPWSFRIRFAGTVDRPVSLVLEDGKRELSSPVPNGYPDFDYLVQLPKGFDISGFRLEAPKNDANGARPVTIAEAGLVPRFVGINAEASPVLITSGVVVRRSARNPAAVESIGIDLARAGIDPADRYIVSYAYTAKDAGSSGMFVAKAPSDTVKRRFRTERGADVAISYGALFPRDTATIDILPPPGSTLRSVAISPLGTGIDPLNTDLAGILRFRQDNWRSEDFEVFRWNRFPSIIVFDTKDYAVQDALFKRIAFFVEKKGFKGKLMSDDAIAAKHGWNAHDYRAEDLAAFYDKALKERFPLNPLELRCRDILLASGIIVQTGTGIGPGVGAIISISRESEGYLRTLFLNHESYHGIYFLDPEFRAYVQTVWHGLDPAVKEYLIYYFSYLRYDINNPALIVNEFQAYILQQPGKLVKDYFARHLIDRLEKAYPDRTEKLEAFSAAHGDAFPDAYEKLSSFLAKKYDLPGGRTVY